MGILQKRSSTTGLGQLGATDTNAALSFNVRVDGSYFEYTVSVPIGEAEGQLKCDIAGERRARVSSPNDIEYMTRQAREWTASVKVTPTALTVKFDPFQRLYQDQFGVFQRGGGSGSRGTVPAPSSSSSGSTQSSAGSGARMTSNSYISGSTLSAVVAGVISTAVANAVASSVTSSTSGVASAGNAGMSNALQLVSQAQFLAVVVRPRTEPLVLSIGTPACKGHPTQRVVSFVIAACPT
jgi:hypothetical protein